MNVVIWSGHQLLSEGSNRGQRYQRRNLQEYGYNFIAFDQDRDILVVAVSNNFDNPEGWFIIKQAVELSLPDQPSLTLRGYIRKIYLPHERHPDFDIIEVNIPGRATQRVTLPQLHKIKDNPPKPSFN